MKKILFFTDIEINGSVKAGNVNAFNSKLKNLKKKNQCEVLVYNNNNKIISAIFYLSRAESKLYRKLARLKYINSKFSIVLLLFLYFKLRITKVDVFCVDYIYWSYLKLIVPTNVKFIIDSHDIMHLRKDSFSNSNINDPVISVCYQDEINAFNNSDAVLIIQEDEFNYIKDKVDTNIILTPRPSNLKFLPINMNNNISFIGGGANFNIDGIVNFYKKIWIFMPMNYTLNIYGMVCNKLSENIISEMKEHGNVIIHGPVDNVESVYNSSMIMINPIYYGSGLKMKNIESVSFGKPIITTNIGLQGMSKLKDRGVYEYSDVESFIDLIRLFSNHETLTIESKKAYRYAEKYFGENVCFKYLNEYFDKIN
ncbi:glycosyltransferase family 4 protein [Photobacterium sp. GB-1]|uniref:glycosyltransferase family 4 protein n=1 Tax=Photobacterium sp. GB-1 TaxID=2022111 RepID=UPI000D161A5A|nr:glycosyltransferase [Photobacterium sp. GB-1]PSV50207.1 hypothetical protein C9J45_21160 [Photobacterium sp. GB-1]